MQPKLHVWLSYSSFVACWAYVSLELAIGLLELAIGLGGFLGEPDSNRGLPVPTSEVLLPVLSGVNNNRKVQSRTFGMKAR